jgi:hypothetical protein
LLNADEVVTRELAMSRSWRLGERLEKAANDPGLLESVYPVQRDQRAHRRAESARAGVLRERGCSNRSAAEIRKNQVAGGGRWNIRSEGHRRDWSGSDDRFRLLRMSISGPGVTGEIEAFARGVPSTQPTIHDIAQFVRPGEFTGSTLLVIGASRGLGELAAKIVAAGGGKVIGTYASGREEAERIAHEADEFGSEYQTLQYDARMPPA